MMGKIPKVFSKWVWLVVVGLLFSLGLPTATIADEGFGLSVKPVIPDNQQETDRQGYNLIMKNDEEKNYHIDVYNNSTSEKKIDMMVINSSTMPAGQIDLTNAKPRLIKNAGVKLTDVTALSEDELILPAKSQKKIAFKIKIPKEGLEGILLGSIYLLDKNESEQDSTAEEGLALRNHVGYATEVMVATSTKQKKAKLTLDAVKANAFEGQPAVEIPIENEQGHIIPDLTVITKIRKEGETAYFVEDEKTENKVAPKSIFPHQVIIAEKDIEVGHYVAEISAKSAYGTWEWEKPFEITSQGAKEINKHTVAQKETSSNWWYYIGGIVVILMAVIVYLGNKIRRLKIR